ncbi:hypothetical protein MSG28_004391 [Choristoneura fumiferana]|uniref:Uncharacterized protein n=1 Tax=Choristoneura fumiferana TaxID=7141 RepID=A0ACC0KIM4_CHOFU|nr:hypothetical protein MSG28_004391 [Choristoneura fumiferana]
MGAARGGAQRVGITVGLTVIPQAIAYAGVAGLPPQYGLYSSFMACFVYTVFGSVKDSAIGPTAIAAILTRENLHGLGPEFAVLLAFLSGCVELLMGILQLGFLIDFISGPVSVGFTSAAAIIIATTQVKDILGLSFPGGKFLQKVKDIKVAGEGESGCARAATQALWFLSTTRNILVVLVCAALARGEAGAAGAGAAAVLRDAEGKYVDATQEMLALGVCNIASSLVESMPVSGALSRGAVNHASGVASTAGGVYTGVLVLLSLQYFTPYFFYIPKASLAAVIIAAVVFMMELHVFKPIWRTKKLDIIPAVVTFAACLLTRLELGIVIGIASSDGIEHLVAVVDRSLAFPSAEFVRRALRKAADAARAQPLVLDATHVQAADFTAAKGIKTLIEEFETRGQAIIFYNVKPSIAGVFRGVRPRSFLHAACRAELDALLRQVAPVALVAPDPAPASAPAPAASCQVKAPDLVASRDTRQYLLDDVA